MGLHPPVSWLKVSLCVYVEDWGGTGGGGGGGGGRVCTCSYVYHCELITHISP